MAHDRHDDEHGLTEGQEEEMFDPSEAAEVIEDNEDTAMDSGSDDGDADADMQQEYQLQNDSAAHFDKHKDSLFSIAQHPIHPNIVATGGGDDVAFVFDSTPSPSSNPVLPASYQSSPQQPLERESLPATQRFDGHTDSVVALTFTLPNGQFLVTAGLDGQLRAYEDSSAQVSGKSYKFLGSTSEVQEIVWVAPCPSLNHPNTIALGASDGSVWIYSVESSSEAPLIILQAYYLHTESCTAGCWTPDGKMLASVSEDSSFCLWDPFGEAEAGGVTSKAGQAVLNLTAQDQRFAVDGGLFSVAIDPTGAFSVVGGSDGSIKAIGLPRLAESKKPTTKTKGGQKAGKTAPAASSSTGAGQILISLKSQASSVETLAFSSAPLTLLAAGSVDGSIVLFDTAHSFAIRRHIREAHGTEAVIKVEFAPKESGGEGWLLTSCGNDGVVRQWDMRGGTAAPGNGLLREWRGHRGEGDGGGVMAFVQVGAHGRVVTAGDDGVALVFERGDV
ncbi:MAG: hypothetical protein M1814_002096 [Vezdaea aestivalis]|nr:MAG: hypothetical protein M1814_002096 [Vezdaea aestivalis]